LAVVAAVYDRQRLRLSDPFHLKTRFSLPFVLPGVYLDLPGERDRDWEKAGFPNHDDLARDVLGQ
jgi:hypothetical protein